MGKKAAGVTTPISSRELELICKARHIAGKLEGLREAAEIIKAKRDREQGFAAHHKQNGRHYKAREAMHVVRLLDGEHRNILFRIAELEKTDGS